MLEGCQNKRIKYKSIRRNNMCQQLLLDRPSRLHGAVRHGVAQQETYCYQVSIAVVMDSKVTRTIIIIRIDRGNDAGSLIFLVTLLHTRLMSSMAA
jgi:hypothetical protein